MSEISQTAAAPSRKRISSGKLAVVLVLSFIALGAYLQMRATGSLIDEKYSDVTLSAETLRLPLAALQDRQAHFYRVALPGGGRVKVIALRSEDGVYRAALEACEPCYKAKRGFRQESNFVVCNKCDKAFAASQLNDVTGGCLPMSIERRVEGNDLVLPARDLVAGAQYF